MDIRTLLNFILHNPIRLVYRIDRITKEFYRAGFVSTAISEGIYAVLSKGPATCREIQTAIGSDFNQEGFEAWLDFGVSLGELSKSGDGYRIKSAYSRDLLKKKNDSWRAFFQARVEIFYNYIINTPNFIKKGKKFETSQAYGELLDCSSRTVETILFDVVDKIIPRQGSCRLLEVGCGSGVYIRRACERNPELEITGIELQGKVADLARANSKIWKIDHRVTIETVDIRAFTCTKKYHVVTLYNLIYYFPDSDRTELLSGLVDFLHPGGRLVLTSLCPVKEPSIQLMNLWASMTEGFGPLPHPGRFCNQLKEAGFVDVQSKMLIPGFYLFICKKQLNHIP